MECQRPSQDLQREILGIVIIRSAPTYSALATIKSGSPILQGLDGPSRTRLEHPTADYFTTLLTLSPAGDQITADFAKTLIDNEGLGDDEVTDFLGVSFSATDYAGHFYGP